MIVVDVETSGLSPSRNSILSIGSVDFEHPDNQFYIECQLEPGTVVDAKALSVNGFSETEINDPEKSTLAEALSQWLDWAMAIGDRTLAGHNPNFDYGMLQFACRKHQLGWPFGFRTVDLHALAFGRFLTQNLEVPSYGGSSGISTDKVFELVGLPPEPKPHQGLVGAKMETEAFGRLIYGRNLLPEYRSYEVPPFLSQKS